MENTLSGEKKEVIKPLIFLLSPNIEPVTLFSGAETDLVKSAIPSVSYEQEQISIKEKPILIGLIKLECSVANLEGYEITFRRIINGNYVERRIVVASYLHPSQFMRTVCLLRLNDELPLDGNTEIQIIQPTGQGCLIKLFKSVLYKENNETLRHEFDEKFKAFCSETNWFISKERVMRIKLH